MLCKAGVVFGVDDGELSPCQRDFSEWVAVSEPTVQQQNENQGLLKLVRNVNNNLYDYRPRRISELEN